MRSLAATLLIAAAVALGACGKGQLTATRTLTTQAANPPLASAAPGTSAGQVSRAAALAFARAVNLRPSDVPGFRGSVHVKQAKTPSEQRLNRTMQGCVGSAVAGQAVAEQDSLDFQHRGSLPAEGVASSVTVARSSALATKELKVIRSPHTRQCVTRYLTLLFSGPAYQRTRIGPVSIAEGTPPAAGTSGGFGWRVSTSITLRAVRIPFYLDILGFVYGPAEVSLMSSGLPIPFPAATEQRLFLSLLARARSQPLGR